MEEAGWIAPGIAYARLNYFPNNPEVTEAARRFMRDHATAKAIIFDVRTHIGGGLAQMDAMFPYLFSKETVLSVMESRASVARQFAAVEANFSLREVPGPQDIVRREHFVKPHPTERRLFGAEVIVLTSPLTASAGEAFALSLKTTGRAKLIGETTAGAGNYGAPRPISERFSAFVPVGSTVDPRTRQRWEGEGIEPHIKVPAQEALAEALIRSGVSANQAREIAARTGPQGPFIPPRRR
jgi:C-terminal processing protease CtpA/Prc